MHLIWENVIKNLVLHWTAKFKGLDSGKESYEVSDAIWEAIGEKTATAGETTPSAYGARIPNIADQKSLLSAEMWSFWSLFLGPILLRNRFRRLKYYRHFIRLVRLLNICLKFELSDGDVDAIRKGFVSWVKDYEECVIFRLYGIAFPMPCSRIYYQNNLSRLPACPLTIHAVLHIADSIRALGPVWCYWAYPMERYCGRLQPAIKSRRFPYASLDRYATECAQVTQLKLSYNRFDELSFRPPKIPLKGAFTAPLCIDLRRLLDPLSTNNDKLIDPTCVLLPPRSNQRPIGHLQRIAAALATRYEKASVSRVKKELEGAIIEEWGKVRRVDSEGGDTMVASSMKGVNLDDSRDATFVRVGCPSQICILSLMWLVGQYEVLVDHNSRHRHQAIQLQQSAAYGQLTHIFVVKLTSPSAYFGTTSPETVILAAIRTCKLEKDDPELEGLDIHFYSQLGPLLVDITSVQALVGRADGGLGSTWAIFDRSGDLARAEFNIEEGS